MLINLDRIYKRITERLTMEEVASRASLALDRIIKILNNPFIDNNFWGLDQSHTLDIILYNPNNATGTEAIEVLQVDIVDPRIMKGMSISIFGTDIFDGIYIVEDNDGETILFRNDTGFPAGARTTTKISWYALSFSNSLDMNLIISDIIDIMSLDMKDIAGMSEVTQGVDTKVMKSGSHLRHYIVKQLDGYFYQPNDLLEVFAGK